MKNIIRIRQIRGLLLHFKRHPSDHPRRLVNRTARWGEPPVPGVCRWCYQKTASPRARWHNYCLNFYWVASGQQPEEIQHTLCEICGNSADELDHRLSIEVARRLGRDALLRAFIPDNLRWLCRECHRHKTRQDRRLARFLRFCRLDWQMAKELRTAHSEWLQTFLLPCSLSEPEQQGRSRTKRLRTGYFQPSQAADVKVAERVVSPTTAAARRLPHGTQASV